MGHLTMSQKEAPRPGLLRAAEQGRITNAEGARAAGLSVRQFRRLRAVYRAEGVEGLMHGNRGRPSARRLSDEQRQRVVDLINQKYAGFNDCHLTEKLRTVEKIVLSRALVRRIRHEAGLPAKRKRRAPKHRKRRDREAREGALVLIDGSTHDWLEGRGPTFTLVGAIDDASGKILALALRVREDLHGYMAMLGQMLHQHGMPLALYGDRFGALVRNDGHWSVEEQLAGRQRPTQFGQLLEDLGIAFIAAHSPQAKGRVERMWETLQDRLISELRLLGLTTPEQVEAYLPQFIAEFNARFAVAARERDAAWRSAPRNIERLLACRYTRKVARDNTASLPGRWIQLPPRAHGRSWQGCKVEVRECLDGTALVLHRGEVVARQAPPATPFTLVYREGGHGRRRCPENFTPAPPPAPTPPPRSARRNRRGQLTNIRPPARKHPWRRGYKSPSPAPA
jgi:transposase